MTTFILYCREPPRMPPSSNSNTGTNSTMFIPATHSEQLPVVDELEDKVAILTAQIESLQDKICRCDKSPRLVGQGSADVPFELEYADEVVLPSPNPSSYATPPVENEAPIPTPAPASTLADSDKENCERCPMQPISQLVPIEEMVVDRAEDAPKVAELSQMVTSLVEMREDDSDTGSTVPTDRSSRRSSVVQDPAQASNEGDGGSLFDYVDSAAEQSPGDGDVEPSVPKFGDISLGARGYLPSGYIVLFGYFLKDTHQFAHILPTGYMILNGFFESLW
ncbi:hypothetical protein BJ322DRAFT_1017470 [Thelephora terrestris]|uniref:Uncharacterized protein n=1 Tax=Thelephora terrestris TaxID=56493 RepID=A0A9P6HN63_9AGAM|nr:hypothetical protein BJ322DRAFT_1017470 [Thelephora terrestris]